jgi:hypothetical protein
MARIVPQSVFARRVLPASIVALAFASLAPPGIIGWVGGLSSVATTLIAPVSHPMALLSRWLRPEGPSDADPALIEALESERDLYKTAFLRADAENRRLLRTIEELQRGIALNPDLAVRQVSAPVIGVSSDLSSGLIRVKAGRNAGVDPGAVAAASGLQLLGRVTEVSARTCLVLPITSRRAGALLGRVMVDELANTGLTCSLEPRGDGTLAGPVEDRRDPATGQIIEPRVGMTVRLDDPDHWARSAQFLVIGRVERIEPATQPGRRVVVVVPTIPNLERVSEVVLRLSGEPTDSDADSQPARPRPERAP